MRVREKEKERPRNRADAAIGKQADTEKNCIKKNEEATNTKKKQHIYTGNGK